MKVQVKDLAGGGLTERLDRELAKVVANICDPNTEAKKKREITLKITLVPNIERTSCAVGIECTSKLAPAAPLVTGLFVGIDPRTGEVDAMEPQQGNLFDRQTSLQTGKVVDIAEHQ